MNPGRLEVGRGKWAVGRKPRIATPGATGNHTTRFSEIDGNLQRYYKLYVHSRNSEIAGT